ncbi:hypothetical protein M3Y97_00296300 [Aphelenchoides bicaudatus]|nr:hypothetical protein M3Y97_00296300 [Aphelenchoides bicaudatus]
MNAASNAPPVRFDPQFLAYKETHLKIVQILLNLCSLLLILSCFPNPYFQGCSWRLYTFGQLFIAVCVNGFFCTLTCILLLANAFNLPDAYYQFNFPILERLHGLFAMCMYSLAIGILVFTNTAQSFSTVWLCDLAALFATFLVYAYDYWRRRKADEHLNASSSQRMIV